MLFSEIYGINNAEKSDFFDPVLLRDTKLFIDPFLIFQSESGVFVGSHNKLIEFFNKAFELASKAGKNKSSLSYRKLLNMLIFPEVQGLCLGYSDVGNRGAGSGKGHRKGIIEAIFISIKEGLEQFEHFEEIGIFGEGIGCDRISDITANILKRELVDYTQSICIEQGITMEIFKIRFFNFKYLRWIEEEVLLPKNPFTNGCIILVPKSYLRELPIISPEEFWDYLCDNKNEELRNDFNYEVKNSVNKSEIIAIARKNPKWVKEFIRSKEQTKANSYDFNIDRSGVVDWKYGTSRFVSSHPLKLIANDDKEFIHIIEDLIGQFQLFVEDNSGYKLLWDDKRQRGKKEEASQLLFYGIVRSYCIANNIDISRESDIGRGPVDFKFSQGYNSRVLLEVKLARNTKFWNGLTKQLPQYLKSENIVKGYFMVVVYNENELKKISSIEDVVKEINRQSPYDIKVIVIDAINNKPSASNL